MDGSSVGKHSEGIMDGSSVGKHREGIMDGSSVGKHHEGIMDGSSVGKNTFAFCTVIKMQIHAVPALSHSIHSTHEV